MESEAEITDRLNFERSIFEQFLEYTRRFSKTEWGGLLIGTKIDGKLHCVAAVIPPQKSKSKVYCEFKRELFTVIYNSFEKIEDKYDQSDLGIITWIHTHPGFGVFLSGTDLETYNYLIKLNPEYSAIVVDPVNRDYLAVNSKPGNLNGFSQLEVNLNYLYDFNGSDQSLYDKLQILKDSINSGLNRKIFKLTDPETINVFIPLPLEALKHDVMKSRLEGLMERTQEVRTALFQAKPKSIEDKASTSIAPPTERSDEIHPEVQKLEEYINYFQKIEKEIEEWKNLSVNRTLFNLNLESSVPNPQKKVIFDRLRYFRKLFLAPPIIWIKLTDNHLFYSNALINKIVKWNKIRKIEFDPLKELGNFRLLTYKTGRLFGKERLLIYIPDDHLDKFLGILHSKIPLIFNRERQTANMIRYFRKLFEERENQEQITKASKKEKIIKKRITKDDEETPTEREKKAGEIDKNYT